MAVDILYPRRCPLCGDIVVPKDNLVCKHCSNAIKPLAEPRCKKCSKPLSCEEQEFCYDCVKSHHHYSKGYAAFLYDDLFRKSLSEFKYKSKKEYCDFYVKEIVKQFGGKIHKLNPNALIPVPLHSHKQRRRGFNQAELLAKGIGRDLSLPVITDLLIRKKDTIPQKELSNMDRLKNLNQAFDISLKYQKLSGLGLNRIMLVDDIYTTGSTIEACTNVLIKAGCIEVYFVTVCIGKGF